MTEFDIEVLASPARVLVSVAEAREKLQLKGEGDADEARLVMLLAAAEAQLEADTGRMFVTRELRVKTARPYGPFWLIPVSPVQSVTGIRYLDPTGAGHEWPSTEWKLDFQTEMPRLRPAAGKTWPSVMCCQPDAWTMDVKAGYHDDEDPTVLTAKTAVLMLVEYWFDHGVTEPGRSSPVPLAYETIAWNLMLPT